MRMRKISVPFVTLSILGFFVMGAALGGAIFQNKNLNIVESISENAKDIAGILIAAIAAFIAFFNSIRQNSIAIQMKEDDLERERFAARATLTLALSEICEYSHSCLYYLKAHLESESDEDPDLPRISENVLAILRDNIKFSDEKQRISLIKIYEEIQVQIARFPKHNEDFENFDIHYTEHVKDILYIYMNASNLFNYARVDAYKHVMTIDSAYSINRRYISDDPDVINKLLLICRINDD